MILEKMGENSIALKFTVVQTSQYVPYTPGPMVKFIEGMRKAGLE
jgi:hypothetical protein